MMIVKLLGKLIALPIIFIVAFGWLLIKVLTGILNITHGLFIFLLFVLGILAVTSQMWFQLAQIIGWAMVSLLVLTFGVSIEVLFECTLGRLVGFVCRA